MKAVRQIHVKGDTDVLRVYCRMETDAGACSIHTELAGCKPVPGELCHHDWQGFTTALL